MKVRCAHCGTKQKVSMPRQIPGTVVRPFTCKNCEKSSKIKVEVVQYKKKPGEKT